VQGGRLREEAGEEKQGQEAMHRRDSI
jgi:hypothetical protein